MERKWVVEVRWSPGGLRRWLSLLLLATAAVELSSETLTLNTYYPSPLGIYKTLVTTRDTVLARDGGNVGIGTKNPAMKLDVDGGIRMGSQAAVPDSACSAATQGAMRYHSVTKRAELCDGSAWVSTSVQAAGGLSGWCEQSSYGECSFAAPAGCSPSSPPQCGCASGYTQLRMGAVHASEAAFPAPVAQSYDGQIMRFTCLKQ